MKWLIALSAVLLVVEGLPTPVGEPIEVAANATYQERSLGFASFGSGTIGGQGGATWTVWDAWALRDAVAGNDRRIVVVRGRIDLTALFNGSPGVAVNVGAWKTIQGGDCNAQIIGGGLSMRNTQQVIIRNIGLHNALSYAPGEMPNGNGGIISMVSGEFTEIDNLSSETSTYIWVDHCEFSDDPWIASTIPNNMLRHDGLFDIKRASNYITISNSIFRNHNKNMLIGHADTNAAQDVGRLKVTMVRNWFMGTTQRNPRVRFGEVHVLNNLYTDIGSYGIGAGAGASIYAERNVFINTRAGWRHPDGVPSPLGHLLNVMNRFENSGFDAVPSNVNWNPYQYYNYQPQAVNFVEADVRRDAGIRC